MENNHHHNNVYKHRSYSLFEWLALAVCVIILAIVLYGVVSSIAGLHRQGYIRRYHRQTAVDAPLVLRTWMTFTYINQQFKLPASYLKNNLSITSKNYPNISISALASQEKTDQNLFLAKVEKAVQDYLIQSAPPAIQRTPNE